MSYLLANVPPVEVYIRKEFLLDFQEEDGKLLGVGEYESGHWITTKSIPNQALYFETFIHRFGALYDKLPIHAFVWRTDVRPEELLPLDWLQLWDCFSYNIAVIHKERLRNARCKVMLKDKSFAYGYYLFTIDSCASDPGELDVSWAETPNEHKSFNIIKLDNGQFAAQPNNRVLFLHQSQTPSDKLERPYFRFSTRKWICENQDRWTAANSVDFCYSEKQQ